MLYLILRYSFLLMNSSTVSVGWKRKKHAFKLFNFHCPVYWHVLILEGKLCYFRVSEKD